MIFNHINVNYVKQIPSIIFRGIRRKANPGMENQLKMINKRENLPADSEIDFDNMESDFSNVHLSHKQFEKEVSKYKEKEKLWIIKGKYFKEKHYNFLTWAEKEQIKYLHSQDPEEWAVERLAESFPASTLIIAKVLKSKWSCTDDKRILSHDNAVENNWKLLKSGKIDIDEHLKKHLLKFTDRNHLISKEGNQTATTHLKHKYKSNLSSNEFSRIITDYENANQRTENLEAAPALLEGNKILHKPKKDMYIIDGQNTNTSPLTTLSKLKQTIRSENESTNEKHPLKSMQGDAARNNSLPTEIDIGRLKNNKHSNKVLMKYDNSKQEVDEYPEYIEIPKNIWKKNSTYKLNDCFYDDDGEFLYRVPGLTGK